MRGVPGRGQTFRPGGVNPRGLRSAVISSCVLAPAAERVDGCSPMQAGRPGRGLMRVSFVATPSPLPDLRPAPGASDGDLMRSRLPLPDLGFRTVDLDPAFDIAEQLENFFDANPMGPDDPVLFYVSATVVLSVENRPFVCLNPQDPETGDSLRDLAMVFRDRSPGATAFLLECRHAPDPSDPFRSAAIVAAVKAVNPGQSGIELLVAAHPSSDSVSDRPSVFTRALSQRSTKNTTRTWGSTQDLYQFIHESEQLVGLVPSFALRSRSSRAPDHRSGDDGGWSHRAESPSTHETPEAGASSLPPRIQTLAPEDVEASNSPIVSGAADRLSRCGFARGSIGRRIGCLLRAEPGRR